jgi:2-phospho-L-lactate guanylyltransferase
VLVPVKAFSRAKLRLAAVLSEDERHQLARQMATHVVAIAAPLPVAVVCDDDEVASWATALGARVLWEPGRGLNRAVASGVDRLGEDGAQRVIVAHADLPHAGPLAWIGTFDGVTLVPDHREDGTNVVCVPVSAGFRFSYGPGSFERHCLEVERLALPLRVVREFGLGHDVDVPSDLTTTA